MSIGPKMATEERLGLRSRATWGRLARPRPARGPSCSSAPSKPAASAATRRSRCCLAVLALELRLAFLLPHGHRLAAHDRWSNTSASSTSCTPRRTSCCWGRLDEAAADWLHRTKHVDGVKNSTLADYRQMLSRWDAEARKRGRRTAGRVMAEFGGQKLRSITTAQVERFLARFDTPAKCLPGLGKLRARALRSPPALAKLERLAHLLVLEKLSGQVEQVVLYLLGRRVEDSRRRLTAFTRRSARRRWSSASMPTASSEK